MMRLKVAKYHELVTLSEFLRLVMDSCHHWDCKKFPFLEGDGKFVEIIAFLSANSKCGLCEC